MDFYTSKHEPEIVSAAREALQSKPDATTQYPDTGGYIQTIVCSALFFTLGEQIEMEMTVCKCLKRHLADY
jgi:hypothetical protein